MVKIVKNENYNKSNITIFLLDIVFQTVLALRNTNDTSAVCLQKMIIKLASN